MRNKWKKENNNSKLLLSIIISGTFLSIIYVLNFAFDTFKVFGGYSIQVFLVFYSLGLYMINDKKVVMFFWLGTPIILLSLGFTMVHPIQFVLDYLVSFYFFGLFIFLKHFNDKIIKNKNKKITITLLLITYIISLFMKFVTHFTTGYYFVQSKDYVIPSLILNSLGVLANGALTIPIFVLVSPIVISVVNKLYINVQNKF